MDYLKPHVCPYVTGRCRRAEMRDASVGLNVSKALDVGARAVWCKVGDAEGRRLSTPPTPIHPSPLLTHPRHPRRERHTQLPRGATASHRAHPCAPIDPAATYFTSG